jgi:hypothetical protein
MGITRSITVNGQQYKSPDEMPPEARRLYDEGLRAMRALDARIHEIDTELTADSGAIRVTSKTTFQRSEGSVEAPVAELPSRPKLQGFVDVRSTPTPSFRNLVSSEARDKGRRFVLDLAFWVVVALALWATCR